MINGYIGMVLSGQSLSSCRLSYVHQLTFPVLLLLGMSYLLKYAAHVHLSLRHMHQVPLLPIYIF